jgi:glycerol-3-phosphate acyltransferase PlsY
LWPVVGLLLVPFVPIILVLTGYASIASTSAAVLILAIFGLRAALSGEPLAYVLYALITTVLVALALLPNYKRLIAGEERLVGPRAKKQEAG